MKTTIPTIWEFLQSRGYDAMVRDSKIEMEKVELLIHEYANIVAKEQRTYSAIGAAHYTALNVRGTNARLNYDLTEYLKVCQVPILINNHKK